MNNICAGEQFIEYLEQEYFEGLKVTEEEGTIQSKIWKVVLSLWILKMIWYE